MTTPYVETPEGKALLRTQKPYLVRAMLEWIVEQNGIPHLIVDATWPGVSGLPPALYIPQLALNVSASAAPRLKASNDFIELSMRVNGVPCEVYLPMESIVAVYSPTLNSVGMDFTAFKVERPSEQPPEVPTPPSRPSFLKVVK